MTNSDYQTKSSYELARMADVASPDSPTSPGALWLDRVEADIRDRWEYETAPASVEWADVIHEAADGDIPVYTHERWLVFTDLAAWQEDPSEYGGESTNMTDLAGICLYMIAERLCVALVDEWTADLEADDDSEDDES